MLALTSIPELMYPSPGCGWSPSTRYPEYAYETIAKSQNFIYDSVRNLFRDAGLDASAFGTSSWNPLGRFIKNSSRVFVLPNFVYHRRRKESDQQYWAKCTHASVLRAVIDYVLVAIGDGGQVLLGNAPLQSCLWSNVLGDTGTQELLRFYEAASAPVSAVDLRGYSARRSAAGHVVEVTRRKASGSGISYDLRDIDSHLKPIELTRGVQYRVNDYDARSTMAAHSQGHHRYEIAGEIINSDVIFSVPKLKTHEKVGITCGLKGLVGTVSSKDGLAHHRFGGPVYSGDEYPDHSEWRAHVSRFHDYVNQRPPDLVQPFLQIADRTIRTILNRCGYVQGGAWRGNDTAWRMVLDLYRIVTYGRSDGMLDHQAQRKHLMMIDGVVAGEGQGPLAPSPRHAALLLFSDDLIKGDAVAAEVMGFEAIRLPMILNSWPAIAIDGTITEELVLLNGEYRKIAELRRFFPRPFKRPRGWSDLK